MHPLIERYQMDSIGSRIAKALNARKINYSLLIKGMVILSLRRFYVQYANRIKFVLGMWDLSFANGNCVELLGKHRVVFVQRVKLMTASFTHSRRLTT